MDCMFVLKPQPALQCNICSKIAKDPLQHESCGKLFCKDCLEKHGKLKPCPSCGKQGTQFYVDNRSKNDIEALLVRCTSADIGCQWLGVLRSLKQHQDTCKFSLTPCPKECKDEQNRIRKFHKSDLESHLERDCPYRDYECIHCGEKKIVYTEKEVHFTRCKKILIPCPNDDCTKTVQRQGVKRHLDICPFQETSCKYMRLGCDVRMKRKDINVHEDEDDKVHLRKALDAITSLEEKVDMLGSGESLTFKVAEYRKKKRNNEKTTSPFFYIPNGYRMAITVYINGRDSGENTHISVFANAYSKTGEPMKNFGTVTITLLNQLINEQHQAKTGKDFPTFIRHTMLEHNPERNSQYLKDDALYFRVSVENPSSKPWLECKVKQK